MTDTLFRGKATLNRSINSVLCPPPHLDDLFEDPRPQGRPTQKNERTNERIRGQPDPGPSGSTPAYPTPPPAAPSTPPGSCPTQAWATNKICAFMFHKLLWSSPNCCARAPDDSAKTNTFDDGDSPGPRGPRYLYLPAEGRNTP